MSLPGARKSDIVQFSEYPFALSFLRQEYFDGSRQRPLARIGHCAVSGHFKGNAAHI